MGRPGRCVALAHIPLRRRRRTRRRRPDKNSHDMNVYVRFLVPWILCSLVCFLLALRSPPGDEPPCHPSSEHTPPSHKTHHHHHHCSLSPLFCTLILLLAVPFAPEPPPVGPFYPWLCHTQNWTWTRAAAAAAEAPLIFFLLLLLDETT